MASMLLRMPTRFARAIKLCFPLGLALISAGVGCGGAKTAPERDDVFYLHGGGVIDKDASYETYFPQLDREKSIQFPRLVGVGVLQGDLRFSRPIDWVVRDADYTAEKRFISYQSPRQFVFSILERVDPPTDTWSQVMVRYEVESRDLGAKFYSYRSPIGTANAQGRSYLLKSAVKAKPDVFYSYATEILIRNNKRVVLVQVVHAGEVFPFADEVNAAVSSIVLY